MDHAQISILMLFVGLALIIAEFFIPSGGLIAILATVALAVSVWAAYEAWWETSQNIWWSYLVTLLLLVPLSIGGAFFLLQRTSLGRHVLLDAPSLEEVTPYSREEQHLRDLIGKRGTTLSLLNPGGMVKVEGERFHCECPGMLIEPGEPIEVTGLKGNRLVVRPAPPAADEPQPAGLDDGQTLDELADDDLNGEPDNDNRVARTDDHDSTPLDFDIPQS